VYILGLNAYHGDASAALFKDGVLVAAVEEERLNRKKHAAGFPALAIRQVLQQAGIGAADVDHVAISRDPRANLSSKVLFAMRSGSRVARLLTQRLRNASKVRGLRESFAAAVGLNAADVRAQFHNVEHHRAHLASAFFLSGFDEAACLSIDGFGDFTSTMMAQGARNNITVMGRVGFPHSAGLFYTAVTQFIGFPKYGEEWKMMGLAPYGRPVFREQLSRVIRKLPEGRFELDLSYFTFHREGAQMTWEEGSPVIGRVWSDRFVELLGPAKDPESNDFYGRWADLAASAQAVYEDIYFHVLDHLQKETGQTRLCLAGGCALNSVANGKVPARTAFKEVYVQPAAADNGTSVGAAAYVAFHVLGLPRNFRMDHAYTGPSFTDAQVDTALSEATLPEDITVTHVSDGDLFQRTAQAISDGRVVGWFQGGMEFGPRALGNRSIVADPRRADMKDILNQRIKHRETYRPFAPSVLEEHAAEYFDGATTPSPFMLMVYPVLEAQRARIPAVTHVDHSARVQTVSRSTNARYHALISAFHGITGVPLVLNTSFNEHEPIVCTPQEALACFLRTRMDVLAMGNVMVERRRPS
jgi:carbamoyltransferase